MNGMKYYFKKGKPKQNYPSHPLAKPPSQVCFRSCPLYFKIATGLATVEGGGFMLSLYVNS